MHVPAADGARPRPRGCAGLRRRGAPAARLGEAAATLGASVVTATLGIVLAAAGAPLVIGPFPTGAVRLSDLYAIGAGATLTVLGVPY